MSVVGDSNSAAVSPSLHQRGMVRGIFTPTRRCLRVEGLGNFLNLGYVQAFGISTFYRPCAYPVTEVMVMVGSKF